MNELMIFENEMFGKVRTTIIDGEPYLVGKDVAEILGYKNPRDAIRKHVDEEDKDAVAICDSIGRMQNVVVINESGFYSLVFSSKLPIAKKFKHWVTSDVLKKIRQDGIFMTGEASERLLNNPDLFLETVKRYNEEYHRRLNEEKLRKIAEDTVKEQKMIIVKMKEKVDYFDSMMDSDGAITATSIGETYGMTARELNQLLKSLKIQHKRKGWKRWHLYAEYKDKGYIVVEKGENNSHHYENMKWTPKGEKFIYDKLKEHGIFPILESNKSIKVEQMSFPIA